MPFIAVLKKSIKLLEIIENKRPKKSYITLLGLGNAMDKALAVALELKARRYRIQINTGTETVIDEFEDPQLNEQPTFAKRKVSKIEIKVFVSL